MEKRDEQRILEALLGTILIILLVMMIFLFTTTNSTGNTTTTTITNSFNTNNYYNTPQKYSPAYYTKTKDYDYLDYNYYAYKKTAKGILGNEIEDYIVYVKNQDYKPGYFRVKYYFTDYYGDTKTETMTYYIKPKQGKEFVYKNIYKDKYKFYDWNYEVISRTRI